MLDKAATLGVLDRAGIAYELYEHEAVLTVEEARAARIPHPELACKNLFLRDDKHRAHYLVVMPDTKRRDLKEIQAAIGSRRLSFASTDDLQRLLGLAPGAVTPLGALNDCTHRVEVVLDAEVARNGQLLAHPCDNTATVVLATSDLIHLLRERGETVRIVEL